MPDEFDEYDLLKYVRFADGSVRFCSVYREHKTLAGDSSVPVVSAGMISVRLKKWYIYDRGSMSLKVSSKADDEDVIGKVLEPFGYQYENPNEF